MKYNNPAARLHRILVLAKSVGAGHRTIDAWKAILELRTEDPLEIMSSVGRIFTLPNAVQRAVEALPDLNQRLHLGWKPDLDKAFRDIQWNGQIGQFTQHLSDSLLISLEFVSDSLERLAPEQSLDEARLGEIREEAWSLFERINQAEMEIGVRDYLLKNLALVIQALDDYPFYGIKPLQTALDASIGSVITDRSKAEASKGTDAGEAFWRFAGHLALLLKITQAFIQIGDTTFDLLKDTDPPIEIQTNDPES